MRTEVIKVSRASEKSEKYGGGKKGKKIFWMVKPVFFLVHSL